MAQRVNIGAEQVCFRKRVTTNWISRFLQMFVHHATSQAIVMVLVLRGKLRSMQTRRLREHRFSLSTDQFAQSAIQLKDTSMRP